MSIDLQQIMRLIIEYLVKNLDQKVILIGGAGCVGKSTFAVDLQRYISNTLGTTVSALDLDCYLIERSQREKNGRVITGYDPAGYRLEVAIRDIEALLSGQSVLVSPYDKATSERGREILIEPAEVLILEGVMALYEPIRGYGTVRIFIDADQTTLYSNRELREMGLGFDTERIKKKFALLSHDYSRFIAPQRDNADIVIRIGPEYKIQNLELRDFGQQGSAFDQHSPSAYTKR